MDTDLKESIQDILALMPAGQKRGQKPDWGPEGNRARAFYAAARLGKQFDPACQSCEADLWDELVEAVN